MINAKPTYFDAYNRGQLVFSVKRITKNKTAPEGGSFNSIIVREIHFKGFARFGSDLLSHALRRSTIGAKALNGRVRDGTGCFALAIATKPRKTSEFLGLSKSAHLRCMLLDPGRRRGEPRPTGKISLLLDQIKPIGQLVPVN